MVHIKERISETNLEQFAKITSNLQGKQGAMGSRKISITDSYKDEVLEGECSFKNFVSHFNKLKEECGSRNDRTDEENKLIDTIRMNLLFLDSSTTKGKGLVKVLNSISRKLGDIFGSIHSKINKQFKSESADYFQTEFNIEDASLIFNSFKMISGKSDKAVQAQKELLSTIASDPQTTKRWVRGGLGLLPQFLQLSILKNIIIRPMKNNADDIVKTSFTSAEVKNYIQNELFQTAEAPTDQLNILDRNDRGMSIINKLLESLGSEIVKADPELNSLYDMMSKNPFGNYDLPSSGIDSSYESAPSIQNTSSTAESSSTGEASSSSSIPSNSEDSSEVLNALVNELSSSTTQSLPLESVASSSDIPLSTKDTSSIEQSSSTGKASSSSGIPLNSEDSSEGLNALFEESSSNTAQSSSIEQLSTPASPPPPSDMPPEAPIIDSSSSMESSFEDASSNGGLSVDEFFEIGAEDQLKYATQLLDKSSDVYSPDELIYLLPKFSVTDFLDFIGAIERNPNKVELLKNFTKEILLSEGPNSGPIDDSFIDNRFNSNFADSSRLKTAFRAMLVEAPLTSELSALTNLHSIAKEKRYCIEKSMFNIQKFLETLYDNSTTEDPYIVINNMSLQEVDQVALDLNYLSSNLNVLDTYFTPDIKKSFFAVLAKLPKDLILNFAENPNIDINLDTNGYLSEEQYKSIYRVLSKNNYPHSDIIFEFFNNLLTAVPPSVFADPSSPIEPLRYLVPKAADPLSEEQLQANAELHITSNTPEPTTSATETTAIPTPPEGAIPPPPPPGGLPPPPPPPPPQSTPNQAVGNRGNLLSQIRKGKDLKHVEESEKNQTPGSPEGGDLLQTLQNAMGNRRDAVEGDSEESSNGSEWSSSDTDS